MNTQYFFFGNKYDRYKILVLPHGKQTLENTILK